MAEQQAKDAINKMLKNSRGAGIGVGLLAAAGATAYAVMNSIFTIEAGHRGLTSLPNYF